MKKKYLLENLDCPNCANKLERKFNTIKEVKDASVDFMHLSLTIDVEEKDIEIVEEKLKKIISDLEPDVVLKEFTKHKHKHHEHHEHHHEHCGCDHHDHEHHDHEHCECGHHHEHHHHEHCECGHHHEEHKDHHEHHNHHEHECCCEHDHDKHHHEHGCCHSHEHHECCNHDHHEHDHHHDHKHDEHHHEHNHSCGCGHDHSKVLSSKVKIILMVVAFVVFLVPTIFTLNPILELVLYIIAYLLVGLEILYKSLKNILKGEVFDENFLMSIATIVAFGIGEYQEAFGVMFFYQIGEALQDYAVNKSRKSISSMLKLKTNTVSKVLGNEIVEVDCESLEIGDIFIVKVGEQIPVDGRIVEGSCSLDTSCLTGESLLVNKGVGDEVLSGSLNKAGIIKVKAIKDYEDSTYAKILDMVENATANKAPSEKFITKFARVYTPVVVFLALAIAIIPLFFQQDFATWGYRACVFLVTSCPCALVVSVPLSYFVGIGKASRNGILVKGSNYLEEFNKANVIYLDKTGTITKGSFKVEEVIAFNVSKEEVIDVAASIEILSNHPIAESIVKASNKTFSIENIKDHKEVVGKGIEAYVLGDFIKVGNYAYVNPNIKEVKDVAGSVIYVSKNNELLGYLIIQDEIKEDALEVINKIHSYGIETCMLTGDNEVVASYVANKVGIKNYKHSLLPLDKTTIIKQDDRKKVFVGDGVNDAPSLVGSDVGIAMGALGSDVAIESSDIVLMKDNLSALVDALKISKKTNKIVTQNIVFSLGIKVLIMLLGVFGLSTLWMAVFADVGVTLLAVLNSLRVNKIK